MIHIAWFYAEDPTVIVRTVRMLCGESCVEFFRENTRIPQMNWAKWSKHVERVATCPACLQRRTLLLSKVDKNL